MRLLYLTPGCFDKGGISRYNRYQITALRELLGEGNVYAYSFLGPDDAGFETPFSVTFHGNGANIPSKSVYAARVVANAIRYRPQAVLGAHVNLSGLARVTANLVGAQVLVNVYGLEVWSGMRTDAAWGLRKADHVIADCHFTASYLEQSNLRPTNSVAVAWDCVDTNRFFPSSPSAAINKYGIPHPNQGFNILTLGRMSRGDKYKGYERLLEVFERVAEAVPYARLIYAGGGDLIEDLRRTARERKLAHRVFFTGMIHEDDLADVYRSAHLFSFISDRGVNRGEGIPLTPLEAAACGVPILVGNQDGSREAVVPEVNGRIFDPFDLEAQAQTIIELANDSERQRLWGKQAAHHIQDEFAYNVFREKHRTLLAKWFPGKVSASNEVSFDTV